MKKKLLSALLLMLMCIPGAFATDYGLPDNIQDGNILHCFDWSAKEIKAELANIAAAGFGAVQMSPLQRSDVNASGTEWHNLYRPYDIAFKSSGFCSETDLEALCTEAEKYGIKIIVDIVANHVDRTSGYHDTWWDSNGRVRWNGSINYGDRYSITHGQLGDYGDINSEDSEVIARAKAYVEKLKSLGVKGCRWDAAKHIGLPSEGCNFWSEIASVSGMYHYGEVLDTPGPDSSIIKEYVKYMSVTDNRYSNNAAHYNGGIPSGYGGEWAVNQGVSESKLVYWGESHDTYSNDEWSQNIDQSVIDRAYAAMACRSGATCLYFARPNTKGFSNIKTGKGSTAFKSTQIAEVNKFRNAMIGRKDYFASNGSVCSITRENGGAVIVSKSSGNVSITNGGGYCPAGTYKDRVSGNTFTVTSTTISGTVGSSGIAVIYADGITPIDPDPSDGDDGDDNNSGDDQADDDFSSLTAINGVYLKNSAGWSTPYVWAWNGNTNCTASGSWPGDQMTKVGNYWKWEVPSGKTTPAQIIFNMGSDSAKTADLTYVNSAVYDCNGNVLTTITASGDDNNSGDDGDDNNSGDDGDITPDPDSFTIYYDNSESAWNQVNIHYWSSPSTSWPGVAMTKVAGDIWSYTFPSDPSTLTGFLFCDGVNNSKNQSADYTSAPINGHIYKCSTNYGAVTDEGVYTTTDPDPDPEPTPDPDPTPDPTPNPTPDPSGDNIITDYYKVNPNGQVGTNKTINMTFTKNGGNSIVTADNAMTNWTENELIAQGVARDIASAVRGRHEYPCVDSYAIYAAYDATNLYLGVQYVYSTWDLYGDGILTNGAAKPWNMDGRLMIAFDLDPNLQFDGVLENGNTIWDADGKYNTFNNGTDCIWLGSTKSTVGTPGLFFPNANGYASYDAAYCKSIDAPFYGCYDGLLPSITAIYGQKEFGYDPEVLEGNDGFTDIKGLAPDDQHTFYEFKFPLAKLGITESYIKNTGIGVMVIDTYGQGAIGSTPYDPTVMDNANVAYSKDSSSSAEKEDTDVFTVAHARIGKLKEAGVETIVNDENNQDATPVYYNLQGIRVDNPSGGIFILRQGSKVTKTYIR
jgi:alpha-amylase